MNLEITKMEKLKIVDDGQLKKIELTDKYAKGIFRVVGKAVKKNCETLNIDLSGNNDPLELIAEFPSESKDALRQAYNLTKMNTLQDFSFLGGPLDSTN